MPRMHNTSKNSSKFIIYPYKHNLLYRNMTELRCKTYTHTQVNQTQTGLDRYHTHTHKHKQTPRASPTLHTDRYLPTRPLSTCGWRWSEVSSGFFTPLPSLTVSTHMLALCTSSSHPASFHRYHSHHHYFHHHKSLE